MSLRITHNIEAMNATRNLQANTAKISAVDGEALVRLPHQPRGRRRRRPRHLRVHARRRSAAWPRPSATSRTASRWCRPPRATSTRSTRCSSASASWPCSTRTARSTTNAAHLDPERGQPARLRDRPHRHAGASSTASTLLDGTGHGVLPGRRQRRRADRDHVPEPGGHGRHVATRRWTTGNNADISEIDAAITAVSAARGEIGRGPEPPRPHAVGVGRLPGEPDRRPSRASATSTWPRRWST